MNKKELQEHLLKQIGTPTEVENQYEEKMHKTIKKEKQRDY